MRKAPFVLDPRGSYWHMAAWYAHCIINDQYTRPLRLNALMQDFSIKHGIVFG